MTSDNGTPDNTADDIIAVGKLGEIISLLSPATPAIGTAIITADFEINRAHFTHDVGLGINASITIDVLQGKLRGAWVPSFLRVSFGPVLEFEFPEDGLNASLGTFFSDDFEVAGSAFNTEHATYEVFYAQESVAPTGWDPELPGAEEAIYGYFEASYQQLSAVLAEFDTTGFNTEPDSLPSDVDLDYSDTREYPEKVFFAWIAAQDNTVVVNPGNGSLVMVAPSVRETVDGPIIQENLLVQLLSNSLLSYQSSWQRLYGVMQVSAQVDDISYHYNGKTVTVSGKTNVVGQSIPILK